MLAAFLRSKALGQPLPRGTPLSRRVHKPVDVLSRKPGLALPVGIWYFIYIFTNAGNYVLGLENNALTVGGNAVVLGWAIWVATFHRSASRFVFCWTDAFVGAFLLLVTVHYIWARGVTVSVVSLSVNIVAAYWVSRRLFPSEIAGVIKVFFFCGVFVLIIALFNLPFVLDSWRTEFGRPLVLGSKANTVIIACYVGFFAVQLIAQMQRPVAGNRRILSTLSVLFVLVIVLIAYSGKTSLIAASLISGALIAFSEWSMKRVRMTWFVCFLGAGMLGFAAAPDKLVTFYAYADVSGMIEATNVSVTAYDADYSAESGVDDSNTMAIRIVYIRDGFSAFRENLLFGYGPDRKRLPHSTLLQVFFEYGCIAGLAFIAIIGAVVWQLRRIAYDSSATLRNEAWILLGLYLYVVLYDQVLGSVANLAQLFLLTGAAVALVTSEKRRGVRLHKSPSLLSAGG